METTTNPTPIDEARNSETFQKALAEAQDLRKFTEETTKELEKQREEIEAQEKAAKAAEEAKEAERKRIAAAKAAEEERYKEHLQQYIEKLDSGQIGNPISYNQVAGINPEEMYQHRQISPEEVISTRLHTENRNKSKIPFPKPGTEADVSGGISINKSLLQNPTGINTKGFSKVKTPLMNDSIGSVKSNYNLSSGLRKDPQLQQIANELEKKAIKEGSVTTIPTEITAKDKSIIDKAKGLLGDSKDYTEFVKDVNLKAGDKKLSFDDMGKPLSETLDKTKKMSTWKKAGISGLVAGGLMVAGGLVLSLSDRRGQQTNGQLYGQQPLY
jgi:hypothetical protein